jgi:hypothetical protein
MEVENQQVLETENLRRIKKSSDGKGNQRKETEKTKY